MHMVLALLCFVVVIHWLIFPYPSGLLHWHCGNLTIVPVPAKQPWWIWINTSCEFIMNDCITTTKQSTTKPCAYFLGYTVCLDHVFANERTVYIRKVFSLVLAKPLLIHRYKSDLDMIEWPKYLWISPFCGPSLSTIQYYLYPLHPAVRPRSALMNSKCRLTGAPVLLYNHRQWPARTSFHRYIHLYLYMYVLVACIVLYVHVLNETVDVYKKL